MIVIFAGGHISGGHFNPTVTMGVWASGRNVLHWWKAILYIFFQVLGSMTGALFTWGIRSATLSFAPGVGFSTGRAFLAEFLFLFLLVYVVLQVATTTTQANNSFFGMAIGFVILIAVVSAGGYINSSI